MQAQGLGERAAIGSTSVRAPGKSGVTFNHILSRLQGELQMSQEMGAELLDLIDWWDKRYTRCARSVVGMWFYYYLLFNMLTMFFLAS
jgi:hypothetical protein